MSEERTQRRQQAHSVKWIAALAVILSTSAEAAPLKCAVTLRSGGTLTNASVFGGHVCIQNARNVVIRGSRIRPRAPLPAMR